MKLASSDYDVFDVPIYEVYVDEEFNCRDPFGQDDIQELKESIQTDKLMFPVVVQPGEECDIPAGFKFRLICGFRRMSACKALGWQTIPANVRVGLTERQAQLFNLQENLERKNLNIYEEAKALDKLFPAYRTDQSIATELKKNRKWVIVRRKLMILSERIKKAAASGRLSARDLQAIIAHPDPDYLAEQLLHAAKDRKKYKIIYRGKQKRNKSEVQALITEMLAEGFNPNLLRLLGWAIGEVDDAGLQEARRWLRDRKGWLK